MVTVRTCLRLHTFLRILKSAASKINIRQSRDYIFSVSPYYITIPSSHFGEHLFAWVRTPPRIDSDQAKGTGNQLLYLIPYVIDRR